MPHHYNFLSATRSLKKHLGSLSQICLVLSGLIITSLTTTVAQDIEQTAVREKLAAEIEDHLYRFAVNPWYPRIVDEEHGGFLTDFDAHWNQVPPQKKMIVTQSRHVWTPSRLARFNIKEKNRFGNLATHGARFLQEKMWDHQHGGFYYLVSRDGTPVDPDPSRGQIKTAYGNAFAIYGLSAHHRITGDTSSLALAQRTFQWLEDHSHDSDYGGYFQFMLADGTPLREGHNDPPKDQNSSIHLIEAFCELYQEWPDPHLRDRIEELLFLIRDTITTNKGHMNLFFDRQWNPISYRYATAEEREAGYRWDHVSFGHDIETAYLLQEASEIIYGEIDEVTVRKTKKMVDHTLQWAWDQEGGGLLDRGYYFEDDGACEIIEDAKVWWAQVEALNTLLIMADLYPDDAMDYGSRFVSQWNYIKNYLFDQTYPGVYSAGLDTEPHSKEGKKASIWKGNYHTVRSLVNCVERLRGVNGH